MNWTISNAFRQVGKTWTLAYKGKVVAVPDLRGLHDIARLLRKPKDEVRAIELAGALLCEQGIAKIETRALQNYRTRLREIDEEQEILAVQGDSDRATSLEGGAGPGQGIRAISPLGLHVRSADRELVRQRLAGFSAHGTPALSQGMR